MSTDLNKNVVRRFITEVLQKGNVDLADEFMAPNYMNKMTGADLAGMKAMLTGMHAALPDNRMEIESLVAEGDEVVARFTMEATHSGSLMGETPTGKKFTARGLTYYRLANGKIVEDDPMTTPDLMQALGVKLPTQSGH